MLTGDVILWIWIGAWATFCVADGWAYTKAVFLRGKGIGNYWPGSGFYELSKAIREKGPNAEITGRTLAQNEADGA